jgi:hypothetical protein
MDIKMACDECSSFYENAQGLFCRVSGIGTPLGHKRQICDCQDKTGKLQKELSVAIANFEILKRKSIEELRHIERN